MDPAIVKTRNVYMLVRIEGMADTNAVRIVKNYLKNNIIQLFGITTLILVDFKVLSIMD
ncbi:conserved protein, unknown function, partial [Hepatocystis sp. ex Piliocolobus tephrosceles]